ncbi:translational GTPase TypA [Prauserella endophytica]|uniref:Large ribosomal subunit assembly factor BipA n=1 Tax=Prauserella endophytica TaxID=1592324 RepID=A0ABY2RS57_9PSEU|nr:translational GTPase TypA [Prauserella endophytica]TKG58099.1 translational GTPase TypA [Prauserella endophytica]
MTVEARPAPRLPHELGSGRRSRPDLRNIAIVAHVDHGKTTLVDAMLRQSGAFTERAEPVDRVMDSGELEREKGITILAKNTAIRRQTPDGAVTINVIDTPGHADFGGEVERGLSMVDGVVLLVDASEGPLPQTRFVLRKTLQAGLPVILVVNKVDRADARIAEVVEETHDLLLDLASDIEDADLDAVLDLPVVYAAARDGRASLEQPADGAVPDSENLDPLFEVLLNHIPPPTADPEAPLRALVTNLDASSFLGRIALVRIHAGKLRKGQTVAWLREDGSAQSVRISELLVTEALTRVPAQEASAGDLVAIAGIPDITIGDTLADVDDPEPLPRITVDEPAISMTIGVNTSPLAGRGGGDKLTARMVKARLDAELVGNVSIRVLATERPDAWEVQGRGELALAILVEQMRREGFELTVGKPQVVTRIIDGKLHEPFERLYVDAPEEHMGAITQLLASRKGRMEQLDGHGTGRIKLEYVLPARGLIGFRTDFLTETRGTGIANHVFEGYFPWAGEIRTRHSGSLVADRSGPITSYAMLQLADRGTFFVEPGAEAYEGMVVGENPRAEDLDINITKEKKLTNMRSSTGDELERLARPRKLGLEEALEFCSVDECVEVAPNVVRVRKVTLDVSQRAKERSRAKSRDKNA